MWSADLEEGVIIPAGIEGSEGFHDAVVFSDEDRVESAQPNEHVDTVVTWPTKHTQDRYSGETGQVER